jgi:ribosomal subunit interface protein
MESDMKTDAVTMKTDAVHAEILVRSADGDLKPDLAAHAPAALTRIVEKYSDRLGGASIYFSRERRLYRCTINVETAEAGVLTGEGSSFSVHEAFTIALRKVGKQLRRRKRALEARRSAPPAGPSLALAA